MPEDPLVKLRKVEVRGRFPEDNATVFIEGRNPALTAARPRE